MAVAHFIDCAARPAFETVGMKWCFSRREADRQTYIVKKQKVRNQKAESLIVSRELGSLGPSRASTHSLAFSMMCFSASF